MSENMKRLSYMTNHKEQIAQMMYKELDAFVTMHMQDVKLKYLIILGDHVSTLMERAVDDATREPIRMEHYMELLENMRDKTLQSIIPGI